MGLAGLIFVIISLFIPSEISTSQCFFVGGILLMGFSEIRDKLDSLIREKKEMNIILRDIEKKLKE